MTIIKCLLNASHGNENGKNVAVGARGDFAYLQFSFRKRILIFVYHIF